MESSLKLARDGSKQSRVSPLQAQNREFGNFVFPNGDRYEGQYLANKHHLTVMRDGEGTYWSKDSVYTGRWCKDQLEIADPIIYPDKSEFTGTLENMLYTGLGIYKHKEGVVIKGVMHNNQFFGDVELTDFNGHKWRAVNYKNENQIYFVPVSPFWESILKTNNSLLPYNNNYMAEE